MAPSLPQLQASAIQQTTACKVNLEQSNLVDPGFHQNMLGTVTESKFDSIKASSC